MESVVLVTTREPSVLLIVHQMEDMLLFPAVVTSFDVGAWAGEPHLRIYANIY